mmetsp:Transcript_51723/g.124834  ORF Transcript_51723/g.124834 Transcript_51723/m.124834 type:complete len:680 (+) Transcript_51723:69-2108(+)
MSLLVWGRSRITGASISRVVLQCVERRPRNEGERRDISSWIFRHRRHHHHYQQQQHCHHQCRRRVSRVASTSVREKDIRKNNRCGKGKGGGDVIAAAATAATTKSFEDVTATCLPGLENVLQKEVEILLIGHGDPSKKPQGPTIIPGSCVTIPMVSDSGSGRVPTSFQLLQLQKACLFLGTATNIRIKCGQSFRARKLPELRRKVSKLVDWKKILSMPSNSQPSSQTSSSSSESQSQSEQSQKNVHQIHFHVRVVSKKSKLYHTGAIRERVIGGIQDALNSNDEHDQKNIDGDDHANCSGRVPTPERTKSETKNVVRVVCTDCTMNVDDGGVGGGGDENSKLQSHEGINDKSEEKETAVVSLDVSVAWDQVDVFLNAYPTPLHQRHYRLETAKAPLREDIAYAMLIASGFLPSYYNSHLSNDNAHHRHNLPQREEKKKKKLMKLLVDPFCGSGTIPIEGAAMVLGLPPGRLKGCPFQGTVWEDKRQWKDILEEAMIHATMFRRKKNSNCQIRSFDRNAGAIQATRNNATRAGVLGPDSKHSADNDLFSLQQSPLTGQSWVENTLNNNLPQSVLVCTNPPFGKRIGGNKKQRSSNELLSLYQTLGQKILNLAAGRTATGDSAGAHQYSHRHIQCVLLTDDPKLAYRIGLPVKSKRLFQTKHGGIDVSALAWELRRGGRQQ